MNLSRRRRSKTGSTARWMHFAMTQRWPLVRFEPCLLSRGAVRTPFVHPVSPADSSACLDRLSRLGVTAKGPASVRLIELSAQRGD
jgi:hypothetical protein